MINLDKTNYRKLREKLTEYVLGLKLQGYYTIEDYYSVLDDFDEWIKTAKIGNIYYFNGIAYKLKLIKGE